MPPRRFFAFDTRPAWLAGLLLLLADAALAAPVTFNTALPVSQGHWVGRQQLIYSKAGRDSVDVEEITSMSVLGYGVTPDLAVFIGIPWTHRDLDQAAAAPRDASGLGDMPIFARYTAYRRDMSGGTFRIAPFLGVEAPTGNNRQRDRLGLLPPQLQPGSGSWDALGGVVASWASIDFNVDGQVAWQNNTRADGVALGDVFQADIAFLGRLLPRQLTAGTAGFLLGGIELNFQHMRQSRIGGVLDANTGGERFFITPALQYARRLWMAEAAVQIPVAQSPNGNNVKQDIVLRLGIRLNL